jgi:ATP-dependent RNA helicase DDX41
LDELEERKDEEEEEAKRKEKARKERTLLMEAQDVHLKKAEEGECSIYLDIS